MYTINHTKITSRLPLFNHIRGAPKFGLTRIRQQNRGFVAQTKMTRSLDKCDQGIESRSGIIRPATEVYADEAVEALRAGKVIAVPTDTLYGFACDACSVEAVNRIYEIKGRKHTSPLAICVGDVNDIGRFAVTDHLPFGLLEGLLPGPVTMVLTRAPRRKRSPYWRGTLYKKQELLVDLLSKCKILTFLNIWR